MACPTWPQPAIDRCALPWHLAGTLGMRLVLVARPAVDDQPLDTRVVRTGLRGRVREAEGLACEPWRTGAPAGAELPRLALPMPQWAEQQP